jgi:hypothetical protein
MTNAPDSTKTTIDPGHGDRGGEGNPDAARRYDAGVEKSVKEGRTEELAEKAKEALEGDEGASLREAEQQGRNAQIPAKK